MGITMDSSHGCLLLLLACSLLIHAGSPSMFPPVSNENLKLLSKGKLVPPCQICRNLVHSFLNALNETSRQSFAGGDADWEEQKLGSYENSELRLIEIEEKLCSDVKNGKDQCYNLAEIHESILEEWFYSKRRENIDLLKFLCIDYLKVCCPDNTYGPNCIPCPGGIITPCGGHGKCEKSGTREEPAKCLCDVGYSGQLCDECDIGYFQVVESTEIFCKTCDIACKGHCRGPGPQNCEVCSDGYLFDSNLGCVENSTNHNSAEDKSLNDTDDKNASYESVMNDSSVQSAAKNLDHSEL